MVFKKAILFLVISMPLGLLAQNQKKRKLTEPFSNSISAADLKKHLYVIASKEMEGRDTPSPGQDKAADYIEAHFKLLGLKPGNGDSYRQYYPLYKDSILSSSLKINGVAFDRGKDFVPGNNYSAEIPFSEVVFAGYGIVDEKTDAYKELDVRGKAVLVLEGAPADYKPAQQRIQNPAGNNGKINAAARKGAAAVFIITNNISGRNSMQASWNISKYRPSVNPLVFYISEKIAAAIMGDDGKDLVEKFKTNFVFAKSYQADIDLSFQKTTLTSRACNVLALLEGTDKKDEYVVITAHYDHVGIRNDTVIYYGADDDGSGTVSVLELAEAFAKAKAAGKGPRRSILFMTVSGEEHGLWGSAYYTSHPVYPLQKTSANLNIDMIGRIGNEYMKDKDSANYIYVIGDNKLSSDLTPLIDAVNESYTQLKLDRKYNDPNDPNRFYYRSDHYNFAEKGVPILFFFNGVHPDYHRPTDTPDKINYGIMEKRARLVYFTAREIANREEMLKRDRPLDSQQAF
jgi:Zn-dependent M28 family amino/carboxypeptidase